MKILKILGVSVLIVSLILFSACQKPSSSISPGTTTPSSTGGNVSPGSPPVTTNNNNPTTVTGNIPSATGTSTPVGTGGNPPPTTNLPFSTSNAGTVSQINVTASDYVVFAWNDLGMHCANPTYDTAVLLPPYNTLWAQVVKRGNPPQIVTRNITVEYSFVNNTSSYNKGSYNQFWDNVKKLFGINLDKNKGLNVSDPNVHNGLSGTMAVKADHFEAVGTPLTPIDDSNIWNPYQVAQITVKDTSGKTLVQTRTMAPISDEINCSKCHGSDAFNDILAKHDKNSGTNLVNQKPVLCASCHGDPALGATNAGQTRYLSADVHGFHSTLSSPPACYDCHPGQKTQCSRSTAHTAADGNCTACHGDLTQVSSSIGQGRVPWVSEPKCVTCHGGVAQVDTGSTLYRNATGHSGIYCASCHSSPHAMVPTSQPADNYQALEYQGKAVPIADCAACHRNSKGGGNLGEYPEAHEGTNPEHPNGCYICHTSVNTNNTSQWPHAFQWKSR
jgi:hypothetical protein